MFITPLGPKKLPAHLGASPRPSLDDQTNVTSQGDFPWLSSSNGTPDHLIPSPNDPLLSTHSAPYDLVMHFGSACCCPRVGRGAWHLGGANQLTHTLCLTAFKTTITIH